VADMHNLTYVDGRKPPMRAGRDLSNAHERSAALDAICSEITKFEQRCNDDEHTDVGAVWELLYFIRDDILQPQETTDG
jgi:hypothetical protein